MANFTFCDVCEKYFSPAQYAAIRATIIGIAGAGGLGSNCATMLVRCGFEKFVIADFDVVETSNLNRQAYYPEHIGQYKAECLSQQLAKINPAVQIAVHTIKLDNKNAVDVYSPCDVVVEAFDKPENKAWFVTLFIGTSKLVVSASGLAGYGNSDRIITRKIHDNFYLIGDGTSGVGGELKPLSPGVNIAAAKEADVVLEWVLSKVS